MSPAAGEALVAYRWPGNVRELVNCMERAVSFCDGDIVQLDDLPEHLLETLGAAQTSAGPETLRASTAADAPRPPDELINGNVTFKDAKERWVSSFEKDYILSLLRRHGGNISHAARDADIDRKYFRKLMKKYDIEAADADVDD